MAGVEGPVGMAAGGREAEAATLVCPARQGLRAAVGRKRLHGQPQFLAGPTLHGPEPVAPLVDVDGLVMEAAGRRVWNSRFMGGLPRAEPGPARRPV